MDGMLLIIGGTLVLLCVGQLGLWTAASLRLAIAEGRHLRLRQQLVAEEIRAARTKSRIRESETTAWQGYRRFIIQKVVPETHDTTSVYLVPQDQKPLPEFLPGQHLTLRFLVPGQPRPLIRCYSLSDRPHQEYYRITVKAVPAPNREPAVPAGLVSNYVPSLKPGMLIDCKAPAGEFYLDMLDQRPAILLAGGIGITPMLSMIETTLEMGSQRELLLLYGVRHGQDHAFRERLSQLAQRHPNLNVVNCYSAPQSSDTPGEDYHVKGRINVDLLKRTLPSNNFHFYLCGPGSFMQSLGDDLKAWGVESKQIHSEAFGPASLPQKPALALSTSIGAESTSHNIQFFRSGITLAWNQEYLNLLEAAEDHEMKPESGCRAGACGTCQWRLISGKVRYPGIQPAEQEMGTCLPCIAIPDGDLEIDA